MLEFAKILRDIDNLGRERAESLAGLPDELKRAEVVMSAICGDLDSAGRRIGAARTSWLTTTFDEPPDRVYDLPDAPPCHVVVAADGSQIMPGKHEVTLCYLLNVASVILYYGIGERPVSTTAPKLCYRDEDLFEEPYGGRRVPVNDKLLAMRRTLAESAELESAIRAAKASGIPVVALWDGSLIRWALENEPPDYKQRALDEYLRVFDTAMELRVPIAGYISDPGSKDFVNSMRIMLCHKSEVKCDNYGYAECETKECDAVARLKDSHVYHERLMGGKRSVLFTSSSTILEKYREHEIRAFYMDAGKETVRIEVPEWVAADRELLDLTHAVCCDQARKGRGYPVALAEAHEHAVVRSPERNAFFQMIERSFIKHGARVSPSLKRISKGY
ncbi:MAG TPA: DNA double-strand break repair nuclease NurA [Armatimonadota bacterium]|nr:DNA double-strand break repair nuclease NurA [Armatimonadota bacterium]